MTTDTNDDQAARAGDGKALTLPYSMDLDPAGIRELVAVTISGAIALGAQNESVPPEGHWLAEFWRMGRAADEWRSTVWALARALNCLPSTFSDANGHVLRAAEKLMAERAAAPAVSAPAAAMGPMLFAFATHAHWVMNAQTAWKKAGVRSENTLCIDAKGRHCFIGRDFRIAKEDDAFPVTVYLRRADLAPELGIQAPATVAPAIGSQP